MQRVLEHALDLEHLPAGLMRKDLRDQVFKKMSHFQCDPVLLTVFLWGNIQLAIVDIPRRSEGRDPHDCRCVTAANAFSSPCQPFFLWEICRVYKFYRNIFLPQGLTR